MPELIKLSEFFNRSDADMLKSLLDSEGIHAVTQADDMGGMRPDMLMIGRVRVLVAETDIDEARKFLEDFKKEMEFRDEAFSQEKSTTEEKDELKTENINLRRAYFAAIFGLFILPLVSQFYALILILSETKNFASFTQRDRRRFSISVLFIALTFGFTVYFFFKTRVTSVTP